MLAPSNVLKKSKNYFKLFIDVMENKKIFAPAVIKNPLHILHMWELKNKGETINSWQIPATNEVDRKKQLRIIEGEHRLYGDQVQKLLGGINDVLTKEEDIEQKKELSALRLGLLEYEKLLKEKFDEVKKQK